jgi:hypothetical protein
MQVGWLNSIVEMIDFGYEHLPESESESESEPEEEGLTLRNIEVSA